MPDPGLSPLQSSLPAAAARFGAHVLTDATGARTAAGALPAPPSARRPCRRGRARRGAGDRRRPGWRPDRSPRGGGRCRGEAPSPALDRILRGPTGLGTSGLYLGLREESPAPPQPEAPVEGTPIPGLYYHPVPEPDPARVEEVSRRIKAWARGRGRPVPRGLGGASSTASPSGATWSPAIRTLRPSTT